MSRKRPSGPAADASTGNLFDALPDPTAQAAAPQRFLHPNPQAQSQLFASHAPAQAVGDAPLRNAASGAETAAVAAPARGPAAQSIRPRLPRHTQGVAKPLAAQSFFAPLTAAMPQMPPLPDLDHLPTFLEPVLDVDESADFGADAAPPAWADEAFASLAASGEADWVPAPADADVEVDVDVEEVSPPSSHAGFEHAEHGLAGESLADDWGEAPSAFAQGLPQKISDEDDFDDAGLASAPEASMAQAASASAALAELEEAPDAAQQWANLPEADPHAPDALARLQQHLKAWRAHDQLRSLDAALAEFLVSLDPQMPALALLGAVLASHQLGRGHVCLDLPQILKYGPRALAWRRVTLAVPLPEAPPAGADALALAPALPELDMAADFQEGHDMPELAWPEHGTDAPLRLEDWDEADMAMAEAPMDDMPPDMGFGFAPFESDWDSAVPLEAPNLASEEGEGAIALGNAETEAETVAAQALAAEALVLTLPSPMDWLRGVSLSDWQAHMARAALVRAGKGNSPLVLAGPRLYLRREWQDEQVVRAAITQRMAHAGSMREHLTPAQWRASLDALFGPAPASGEMDWQKAACALAASQGFCIITGGPGTGKTTTVVRLLALLQGVSLAQGEGRTLRIELAAPTGKAAARLGDSVGEALGRLQLAQLADTLGLQGRALRERAPAPQPDGEQGAEAGLGADAASADGASLPAKKAELSAEQLLRQAIPTQARTLHRLLGSQPESRHFRHNARNPLPLDVLVVDEASMVDLDMMARLLQALPPHARLVLLGDKDQLSSVEAGAVLGELCSRAQRGHFLPETAQWLHAVTAQRVPDALQDAHGTPLDQAVVMLRRSHRFDGNSGIGRLASVVNAGHVAGVEALRQQSLLDLNWLRIDDTKEASFAQLVRDGGHWPQAVPAEHKADAKTGSAAAAILPHGHAHYLRVMAEGEAQWRAAHTRASQPPDEAALAEWALRVLDAQRQFQMLCALREGPWGVGGVNRRITQVLADAKLVQPRGEWWAGRPVMVTGNDYGLGLMNGDVGVTLQRPDRLAVAFAAVDRPSGVRWVAPSRLNQVDTVFAMTVHKSQGSEFAHTAVLVPPSWSPVLTRELFYTGITRAKSRCSLVLAGEQSEQVLALTVRRRVLRASGLLSDEQL